MAGHSHTMAAAGTVPPPLLQDITNLVLRQQQRQLRLPPPQGRKGAAKVPDSVRSMIPGMTEDVTGAIGYASNEDYSWMPFCLVVALQIREAVQVTYAKVEVQVIVENGLVIPIRIPRITIATGPGVERAVAIEKLKFELCAFDDYIDMETVIEIGGQAMEPYRPDTDVFPDLGRCKLTFAVVGEQPATRGVPPACLLRKAAKSVLCTGLAGRCLLWMEGKKLRIDTFGTALLPDDEIVQLLHANFDLSSKATREEDVLEVMGQDMGGEVEAVDLDTRISFFTRVATRRSNPPLGLYPIHESEYRNCDARPIVEALRCGWEFLPGLIFRRNPLAQLRGSVRQHPVSPMRQVPDHIPKPEWASEGHVDEGLQELSRKRIEVRTPEEVRDMREACAIARAALDAAAAVVRPGVNTDAIDEVVHNTIVSRGAYPSWLRYGGRGGCTKSCCTSVNEVVCNGVPDARPLAEGDIVTVLVAAFVRGVHGAVSDTFCVGKVDEISKRLIQCSHECLDKVIAEVTLVERYRGAGVAYPQLGVLLTSHAAKFGFKPSKVPDYAGIGRRLESAPTIPQFCPGKPKGRMREWLLPGHTFFLQPTIVSGECQACTEWPGRALVSKDFKPSAACGKTVLVTADGLEVL